MKQLHRVRLWPTRPKPTPFDPGIAASNCRGADKAIKNAEGKTAAEVAELNEQAAVVALLKA